CPRTTTSGPRRAVDSRDAFGGVRDRSETRRDVLGSPGVAQRPGPHRREKVARAIPAAPAASRRLPSNTRPGGQTPRASNVGVCRRKGVSGWNGGFCPLDFPRRTQTMKLKWISAFGAAALLAGACTVETVDHTDSTGGSRSSNGGSGGQGGDK